MHNHSNGALLKTQPTENVFSNGDIKMCGRNSSALKKLQFMITPHT